MGAIRVLAATELGNRDTPRIASVNESADQHLQSIIDNFTHGEIAQIYNGRLSLIDAMNRGDLGGFIDEWQLSCQFQLIGFQLSQFQSNALMRYISNRQGQRNISRQYARLIYGLDDERTSPLKQLLYRILGPRPTKPEEGDDSAWNTWHLSYRIAFTLTLPPAQRDNLLKEFMLEFDKSDRGKFLELIDQIQNQLLIPLCVHIKPSGQEG